MNDEPEYEPCVCCGRYTMEEVIFSDGVPMWLCRRCQPRDVFRIRGQSWATEKVRNDGVN
jgi:hypothetical protein